MDYFHAIFFQIIQVIKTEKVIELKKYLNYICPIIGAVFMAFSVKNVYEPAGMVTGGFSGLGILAERVMDVPLWLTNLVLNVPLFAVAAWCVGKKLVLDSVMATFVYSVAIGLIPDMDFLEGDLFLSCIIGGMIMGLGIGLVLVVGASSGGVDMLSIIIHHNNSRISIPWIMFLIDSLIIFLGGLVFGWVKAIYSIISVWIVSFIVEKIVDGPGYSKACIVISSEYERISDRILSEIGRGVTGISRKGRYTNNEKTLLFCVSSRHEMSNIRKIVYEEDREAFMTITNVSEVLGEGFEKRQK